MRAQGGIEYLITVSGVVVIAITVAVALLAVPSIVASIKDLVKEVGWRVFP